MVQWLGLSAFTAVAQVRSLVQELRSHKPGGTVKKKKKITFQVLDIRMKYWLSLEKGGFGRKKLCWHLKAELRKVFWAKGTNPQWSRCGETA